VSYTVCCAVLLVLAALRLDYSVGLAGYQTNRESRGAPPTLLEWIIFAYVLCKRETHITHSILCLSRMKLQTTCIALKHDGYSVCKTVGQLKLIYVPSILFIGFFVH
jgi:hypothetical protein